MILVTKENKKAMKNSLHLVIRINEYSQIMELSKDREDRTKTIIESEYKKTFPRIVGSFVSLYIGSDKNIQSFFNQVKPGDQLKFYYEDHSCEKMKEIRLKCYSLNCSVFRKDKRVADYMLSLTYENDDLSKHSSGLRKV